MATTAKRHRGLAAASPSNASSYRRWWFRALIAATIAADLLILFVGVAIEFPTLRTVAWRLVAWAGVAGLVGLATVTFSSGSQLGLDAPLLLAAGYLYGPTAAGLVAFIGYVDTREFRREISLERAFFNRAQISLSVIAASHAFNWIGGEPGVAPHLLLGAMFAVGVDMVVNWGMVVGVRVLHDGISLGRAVEGLHSGRLWQFAVAYASFGLLSAVLAETYQTAGIWALAMFLLVIVVGRQAFAVTESLAAATFRMQQKDTALRAASEHIVDERRDERLAIAAGLHDEVLPPLFKVHLMGQVVRQDLASGKLLELDQDVPELIRATEEASDAMRRLIGELRSSPIGARGLTGTLRLLCDQLSTQTSAKIWVELDDVNATPMVQLLTYQVASEAIRNSVRHAGATRIDVSLHEVEGWIRLLVADDGVGFVPGLVDTGRHFGLQLIRERVELCGGSIVIDTGAGQGTRVLARLPITLLNAN